VSGKKLEKAFSVVSGKKLGEKPSLEKASSLV
jgi:hypothetical protein